MKAVLKNIISTSGDGSKYSDIGVLILRVFIGLTMSLVHGMGKFPVSDMLIEGVAGLGFPMPVFFAHAAALAEVVGGLFLAFGFLARPSAGFVAFTMAVAAFVAHAADPFAKKEMALLYLVTSLFFVLHGAGKFSVDFLLQKKLK